MTITWKHVAWLLVFSLVMWAVIAHEVMAQEIYRPMLVKQDKPADTGLFCVTSEEIALGAKLFGVNWIAEPNSMTLLNGSERVEITFTDACATSARLVR